MVVHCLGMSVDKRDREMRKSSYTFSLSLSLSLSSPPLPRSRDGFSLLTCFLFFSLYRGTIFSCGWAKRSIRGSIFFYLLSGPLAVLFMSYFPCKDLEMTKCPISVLLLSQRPIIHCWGTSAPAEHPLGTQIASGNPVKLQNFALRDYHCVSCGCSDTASSYA